MRQRHSRNLTAHGFSGSKVRIAFLTGHLEPDNCPKNPPALVRREVRISREFHVRLGFALVDQPNISSHRRSTPAAVIHIFSKKPYLGAECPSQTDKSSRMSFQRWTKDSFTTRPPDFDMSYSIQH